MRKLFILILVSGGLSVTALAQSSESGTSTGATGTSGSSTAASGSETAKMDTPSAACKSMVETAKSKNFDAFMKMTTDMPRHEKKNLKAAEKEFDKMQSKYIERLQDLSCGNEIVAEDHAVVESESKGQKRLVPFVKTNEGWKFDMRTYQSFYHTEKNEKGSKKM